MRCEFFYCVIINAKVNDHLMNPFYKYLSLSLSSEVYLSDEISFCPKFNRFITLVSIYAIICVYKISCMFIFGSCLIYNLLGMTYKYYVGWNFGY